MVPAGLVLEGGAFRGIFTAGVLDYFMERDLRFELVIGVSAGACCLMGYLSDQPHRTRDCMLYQDGRDGFYGWRTLVETRRLIDFQKLFFEYPVKQFPFDFETFRTSPMEYEIVVTNCRTGLAEYHSERMSLERAALWGEASCAVPFVTNPVIVDGVPYMDGGVSDPVPLARAMERGYRKNVVVMTKHAGFRSRITAGVGAMSSHLLRKYPGAASAFANRAQVYDAQVRFLEEKERNGETFVIRPEIPTIESFEFNADRLRRFYEHGYRVAKQQYPALLRFLEG